MSKEWITVGVGYSLDGVRLGMQDPDDPNEIITLTLEPEFARRVAESLTLRSFECEDARRSKNIGGGGKTGNS